MKCSDIFRHIENWAPKEIAWQKDNVGLQVGSANREVKNILLCLDFNGAVLEEAIAKKCTLIISHHPFLFHPLKKLDLSTKASVLIEKLIKNDITLYSAHTNLDFTKEGVSFQLAKKLGLKEIDFLTNLYSTQYRFVITVPEKDCDAVADAIFEAGGGVIGNYEGCSFRLKGTGTFKGNKNTNPAVGNKNEFNCVEEIKLETIFEKWKLAKVLSAVRNVHPYEELSYDIIPVENPNSNYGVGAVGYLGGEKSMDEFLRYAADKMQIKSFRYSGSKEKIKKVAVCGGSGSDYINDAVTADADAYITADIKYHQFQDLEEKILLIDAGHYETEIFSLDEIEKRLKAAADEGLNIFKFSGSTNPVKFYNN